MESVTEVTCPECGLQQSSGEECTACGATLLSPAEDIQGFQGDQTVSVPWPASGSSKGVSAQAKTDTETVAIDSTVEETEETTAVLDTSDTDAPAAIQADSAESVQDAVADESLIVESAEAASIAANTALEMEQIEDAQEQAIAEAEAAVTDDVSTEPETAEQDTVAIEVEDQDATISTDDSSEVSSDEVENSSEVSVAAPEDTQEDEAQLEEGMTAQTASEPVAVAQAVDSTSAPVLDSELATETESLTETTPPVDGGSAIPAAAKSDTSSHSPRIRHAVFCGNGRSLFGIFIVNVFFTLLTLGIYSFWGRVRVRSFLNSQTSIAGARFAYHGTGVELLTGWAKAMLVFGLPYICLSSLPFLVHSIPAYIPQALAGLLVLFFIPVAVVGIHRYRLSRTSLRNIRFSFRGTVSEYTKIWLKGAALSALTLGIYYPFFENARRQYLVTHTQFGNRSFEYDGKGKLLLAIYGKAAALYLVIMALLAGTLAGALYIMMAVPPHDLTKAVLASPVLPAIPLAALLIPWFHLQAARQRFFWNHTLFGDARFVSRISAWKLFELRLGHFGLLLSTLGLAWPWVQVRNLQFFYFYTGLHGSINLRSIEQDVGDGSPTGEELAGFLDAGFDLG